MEQVQETEAVENVGKERRVSKAGEGSGELTWG